jgi:ribulose-phosphate 3-epimerase
MKNIQISPSILSADFSQLGTEIKRLEEGGADMIHVDVMDGHFVPNLTIGPPVIKAVREITDVYFDAHLMIEDPDVILEDFASAGVQGITVHVEVCAHLNRTLSRIRELGCRAGVAVNPATGVDSLAHCLHLTDLILVMTVNPGFGGQAFIPEMLPKIEQVATMIGNRDIQLQVDGGITAKTAPLVRQAGANNLVAGSAIFGAKEDYSEAIAALRQA